MNPESGSALLSLHASRAALPRLQGDGMDSENLRKYQTVRQPVPAANYGRSYSTLQASDKSTSVQKTPRGKPVPREPVKGAVSPVNTSKWLGSSGRVGGAVPTPNRPLMKDSVHAQTATPMGKLPVTPQRSASEVKIDMLEEQNRLGDVTLEGRSQVVIDLGVGSKVPVEGKADRQVEGQTKPSVDILQLLEEIATMKKQLEMQDKVNTDLKKLLVASMGDDLHCRVESLVRTKAQLACEIGGYTKKMYEDYESLDQMAVQADMWKSKFMATRVLMDKLRSEKEWVGTKWQQGVRALQHLLQEHEQLKECQLQTHRYLEQLQASFDPIAASRPAAADTINVLELGRGNLLLSSRLLQTLLGRQAGQPALLHPAPHAGPSPAEKLSLQVLSEEIGPSAPTPAFHHLYPQVRYDGLTFNCCKRCKGEIQLV